MKKQATLDKRIIQGLEWLKKEANKDQQEVDVEKEKMINNLKSIDRSKMFPKKQKKKRKSIMKKLSIILGNG